MTYSLAGFPLEHPIIPAAGMARTPAEARAQAASDAAMVVVGSYTRLPRGGNFGMTASVTPCGFLNSLGLPNPGLDWLIRALPELVAIAHDAGKPLCVSVAGFSVADYGLLAGAVRCGGADLIELNLSCPNIWDNLDNGEHGRMACFDPHQVTRILVAVEADAGEDAPIVVKLSPYSDPWLLIAVDEAIAAWPMVRAVTASNTFPNATAWVHGVRAITPAGGLAGYSGPGLLPIALGQVVQHRAALPARIQIVGAGGVTTGSDVRDMLRAGADAVAVGQRSFVYGVQVFTDLLADWRHDLTVHPEERYARRAAEWAQKLAQWAAARAAAGHDTPGYTPAPRTTSVGEERRDD